MDFPADLGELGDETGRDESIGGEIDARTALTAAKNPV